MEKSNFNEIEEHIHNWILKISKIRPELGHFAICPFSSTASYKIILSNIDDIVPLRGYDVVIFVVEDYLDASAIQMWCEIYNNMHKDYIFLEDCGHYHTFIQGIQTNNGKYNLILCQSREKLEKTRENLSKTEYYEHWDAEMLKEILGKDHKISQKG